MNDFLKKFTIPLSVFITGGSILIIEIVAIRILAPYFGNTIFTVSGVITIVLLALSVGYYYGGKLADHIPEEKMFYSIILAGGVMTLLLHLFSLIALPYFNDQVSIVWGPILFSFALFFPQNLLLGMLSPFAVKLQNVRMKDLGVGSASGQIFFWSTLGSIFGSLLAGFFLIPHLGVDKIIIGVGLLLVILGVAGILKMRPMQKTLLLCVLMVSASLVTGFAGTGSAQDLVNRDSLYQRIIIFDGYHEGKPARFLQQDRNSSAAMFFDSDDLVYEYTKYYALYRLFVQNPREVLAIGGGAYSVPKALIAENSAVRVDVAEIDPLIYDLAKQYFKVPSDEPRLQNFAEDGRRFLHDSDKHYDFIFSDAYASFFSTPEHLTTREFFTLAKEKLTDKGVFIANVVGSLKDRPESFLLSEINTFRSVFENSYFFAVNSPRSSMPQNFIFVGYKDTEKIDFTSPLIKKNKNPVISNLAEKAIDLNLRNLAQYPVLTDNFAPVDYLISKEFTNLK